MIELRDTLRNLLGNLCGINFRWDGFRDKIYEMKKKMFMFKLSISFKAQYQEIRIKRTFSSFLFD